MDEQADLAAMMGLVGEHVGDHGGASGPRGSPAVAVEFLDVPCWTGESFREHLRTDPGGFGERGAGLALRAAGAMEWWRKFEMRGGEAEPLAADVVQMGKDSGDSANVAARGLGAPGPGIEMLEDQLMNGFVDDEGFQQDVAKLE